MLNLILFGPPGAGKGTQSQNLVRQYSLLHLSTGDMLRAERAAGTALGRQAQALMDAGVLVSDEIVIAMIEGKVREAMAADAKGFIFDGFPRTGAQAEALDAMLVQNGLAISAMIALHVPDEVLRERLAQRAQEQNRPDDAQPEIIEKRIQVYKSETLPVATHYRAQGKQFDVDGTRSIDAVFAGIQSVIAALPAQASRPL